MPRWARDLVKPKNGQYPVVLLAGGPADIGREVRDRLANRMGIVARWHWDREHPRAFQRAVPVEADAVIVLKDFIGHAGSALVRANAKRANVDCLCTSSKWSAMYQTLWSHGFRPIALSAEIANNAELETLPPDECPDPQPASVLKVAPAAEVAAELIKAADAIEATPAPAADAIGAITPAAEPAAAPKPIAFAESDAYIALLVSELQRRLRDPSCSVTGIILTATNATIDYRK